MKLGLVMSQLAVVGSRRYQTERNCFGFSPRILVNLVVEVLKETVARRKGKVMT